MRVTWRVRVVCSLCMHVYTYVHVSHCTILAQSQLYNIIFLHAIDISCVINKTCFDLCTYIQAKLAPVTCYTIWYLNENGRNGWGCLHNPLTLDINYQLIHGSIL